MTIGRVSAADSCTNIENEKANPLSIEKAT